MMMTPDPNQPAARYATTEKTGGRRQHPEPAAPTLPPFALDRHRILASTAFRRLEHKTQVFTVQHHDHFRTRLTHTLEVAHIARLLADSLGLNASLAEVIALAHDLGHPPFGHAGEAALSQILKTSPLGAFNHNLHSLRVVEYLEHPYPQFRGLNLTAATRAGLAGHSTRYDMPADGDSAAEPPATLNLADPNQLFLEGEVASWADRIAYSCHDLEDALGAGFVTAEELTGISLWRQAFERVCREIPQAETAPIHAIRRPVLDALLDLMIGHVWAGTSAALADLRDSRRPHDDFDPDTDAIVCTSECDLREIERLEGSLLQKVYKHPEITAMDARGRQMVIELFEAYRHDPAKLPSRFAQRIDEQGADRVICDYIAGMTDRYCRETHARLCG